MWGPIMGELLEALMETIDDLISGELNSLMSQMGTGMVADMIRPIVKQAFLNGMQFSSQISASMVADAVNGQRGIEFQSRAKSGLAIRSEMTVVPSPEKITGAKRAPRGKIASIVRNALRSLPGSSTSEVEAFGISFDPQIAKKSLGNELRRGTGIKYEKRGKGWFLISENEVVDQDLTVQSTTSETTSQGGYDATTIT